MTKKIIQNFIPDLPRTPYDKGVGEYIGVCAHSTGTYDTTVENEREYEVKNWDKAFVHFFVSDEKILQVADINYKAYGAGKRANGKYVHVELLQTHDRDKFLKAYDNWIWTLAYVLAKKDVGVYDGKTIVSHKWVSEHLGGTNHIDPIPYLTEHGKTWSDVLKDVDIQLKKQKAPVVAKMTSNAAIEFICKKIHLSDTDYWKKIVNSLSYFGELVSKIATCWEEDNSQSLFSASAIIKQGDNGENVKKLQAALKEQKYNVGAVDGIFGPKTLAALKSYQTDNKLLVDGIAGKQTLGNLFPPFKEVKRLPPQINMTLNESLAFIDSRVHLTDARGWEVKAVNVKYLSLFLVKVAYVWQKEEADK